MGLKDTVKDAKKKRKETYERAVEGRWTATKIRDLLERNSAFVERCLCVLLARQTIEEVRAEVTSVNNNMGFTGVDAKFLTSLAKQIIANVYHNPEGRRLSTKQLWHARKRVLKYSGQLALYANYQDIVRVEKAIGVQSTAKDFKKGGVFRKVNYGKKQTPEQTKLSLETTQTERSKGDQANSAVKKTIKNSERNSH